MPKESAGTDQNLIALDADRWDLEMTAACTAAQVGRTCMDRAFSCPQDMQASVTSPRLQAANTESLQDKEQLRALKDGVIPKCS